MKTITLVEEPGFQFQYDNNEELYNYILDNNEKFFDDSKHMGNQEAAKEAGYVNSFEIPDPSVLPEHFYKWLHTCINEVILKENIDHPKDGFFINQIWINKLSNTNQNHTIHFHPNSILSGVYSVRCIKPNNRLLVLSERKNNTIQVNFTPEAKAERMWTTDTCYGDRENVIENDTGTLLIHKSTLLHGVPPFQPKFEGDFRMTIAFNVWMNHLGDFHYATGLSTSCGKMKK